MKRIDSMKLKCIDSMKPLAQKSVNELFASRFTFSATLNAGFLAKFVDAILSSIMGKLS